jgi:hypothetical protein
MFLSAAEKGAPWPDDATYAAIRAQVQAQYPGWNPDRMTMDFQPGDELFSRLLREASEIPGPATTMPVSAPGGGAGLLIAAAAAYILLG